jgi:MADS-box transcription factor
MGRNKLKISPIKKERRRQVTFYKRKKGLIKKAMELSLLCKVNVGLAIIDKRGGLSIFHSDNEIKAALQKYLSGLSRAKEDLKLEQVCQYIKILIYIIHLTIV